MEARKKIDEAERFKREEADRRKDAERLAALKDEEEKILKAKADIEAAAKKAQT